MKTSIAFAAAVLLLATGWSSAREPVAAAAATGFRTGECGRFTVAVIPDTQNYMDFTHQKSAGFALDGVEQYFGQMRWIAENAKVNGGDIVFATHVGDVWQHFTRPMDPEHERRGFRRVPNAGTRIASNVYPDEVAGFEIPKAVEGFRIIAGKIPFSVVPGNHDYDALWTDPAHPPDPRRGDDLKNGIRHLGGLTGFLSAFSSDSEFFREQPWYVGSHAGGADSAQVFAAGQCRFLHIGLQYDPPDSALAWARRVVRRHPGLPTIVSMHNYLGRDGRRNDDPKLDMSILDSRDNNPQMVWDEFISRHDQIFLVLSGHVGGESYGTDLNDEGNVVHQIMVDYQGRGQSSIAAAGGNQALGTGPVGDGWLRLLTFDLDGDRPGIRARTYSTHYGKFSSELKQYAAWYKERDQRGLPATSDEEYLRRADFAIDLADFHRRFDTGESR